MLVHIAAKSQLEETDAVQSTCISAQETVLGTYTVYYMQLCKYKHQQTTIVTVMLYN